MIETEDGTFVPTHEVASIEPGRRGAESLIRTKSGKIFVCKVAPYELEAHFLPIIPASPGYFIVEAFEPNSIDREWGCVKTPVVAWRVYSDRAEAIGIDDVDRSDGFAPAVLAPDGSVTVAGDQCWGSIEDWLKTKAAFKEMDEKKRTKDRL